MKFISTKTHGYIDYGTALVLILGPLLFSDMETPGWVLLIAGILLLGLSVMTRYELGAIKTVPMPAHLGMDMALGALLIVSPWLFGFADVIWWPHVLIGLMEIGVAACTERRPSLEPADRRI